MSNARVIVPEAHSETQKLIMNAAFTPDLRELYVACGTKFGKALPLHVPIPTPKGWVTMGDLKEGDYVFDENGRQTQVIFKTDTMFDHKCYRLDFADGNSVECDQGHIWLTTTFNERRKIRRSKNGEEKPKAALKTTKEIAETIHIKVAGRERLNHQIPVVAGPLMFDTKFKPPIEPYTLGAWLGHGNKFGAEISSDEPEIIDKIRCTYQVIESSLYRGVSWYVKGLMRQLTENKLVRKKRIPEGYLTANILDRLNLLRGLMDTLGRISHKGNCCFSSKIENLADGVEALATSLGIKCTRSQSHRNNQKRVSCYNVSFTTDIPVFHLARKAELVRKIATKAKMRSILAATPIDSLPVQCIKVDSPSSLFLAGKGCIPTHNTISGVASYCALAPVLTDGIIRHVAPIYSQAMIGQRYATKFLPGQPYTTINRSSHTITFNQPGRNQIIEFWHGQNPESLEGEGVIFYLLDEASKMKQQVYDSAITTMTVTRGVMALTSTPRGKQSWFYVKCMEAKDEMEWCLRKGKNPTKIFITAPTSANPYVHPEVIEQNRKNLPLRLFEQYYLASFVDSGEIFPGFRDCIVGDPIYFEMDSQLWLCPEPDKLEDIVIGSDWGKKEDYTVFTAWSVSKRELIGFMRFRGRDYISAIKNLIWFSEQFGHIYQVWHDKTGLGEVIDDALSNTELPYHGVIFTNRSKSEMVNAMMLAYQRRDIKIPNWVDMIAELDAYECNFSDVGNMKYAAGEGFHDDIVSSMFLGWSALLQYAPSGMEVMTLDNLEDLDLNKTDFKAANEDFYKWLGKG